MNKLKLFSKNRAFLSHKFRRIIDGIMVRKAAMEILWLIQIQILIPLNHSEKISNFLTSEMPENLKIKN